MRKRTQQWWTFAAAAALAAIAVTITYAVRRREDRKNSPVETSIEPAPKPATIATPRAIQAPYVAAARPAPAPRHASAQPHVGRGAPHREAGLPIPQPLSVAMAIAFIAGLAGILMSSNTPGSASASSVTLTVAASADAYVNEAKPATNFGKGQKLRADGLPALRGYLRFDVPELSGPVMSAQLRLFTSSKSTSGFDVSNASGASWDENTITFENAPAAAAATTSSGPFAVATWVTIDVTSLVTGPGSVTFAITTASPTQLNVTSRETSTAPELVVETAGANTATPVPTNTAVVVPPATPTNTPVTTPTSAPPSTATSAPANTATVTPTRTPTRTPTTTPVPVPTNTPAPGQELTFPIRAAFYYPWFPQAWTQLGIFPYTKYHPTLGWYDSSSVATIQQHVQMMQYGNIQAGIASWWGQGQHTDLRIGTILDASAGTAFKWSLYYEEESLGDPSVSKITADLTYMRDRYASHANFWRMGGRFVVFVYADAVDACGMADRWAQANTVNAYIVLKVFPGYTGCTNQPANWHQYSPAVATDHQNGYAYAIAPGFDKVGEPARLARDPARWRQNVRDMVASGAPLQLVATFNEWGEGTGVESVTEFPSASGYGTYLDALHDNGVEPIGATPIPTSTRTPTWTPTPGGPAATATLPAPTPTRTATPVSGGTQTLLAAGDIAGCNTGGDEITANMLDGLAGTVITLGDNVYDNGTATEFANCYNPTWGRHKARTQPAPGNHEYNTANATGYYGYFGAAAGDPTKGYYSYNQGAWHIIVINSNCSKVGGCAAGSPQHNWLVADLAANPAACTLAYWHHPRFASGSVHGDRPELQPIWQALYDANADLVLGGHEHNYERFAPQSPSGAADAARGIVQIIAGTGGKNHYGFGTVKPNSLVRNSDTFGLLKLSLGSSSYTWQFLPEPGKTFTDTGTASCH